MTIEEFKLQKAIVKEKIENLNNELKRVEQQFIDSNKEFDIGDKVKITRRGNMVEIGFICSFSIEFDHIRYYCKKEKKDGTMSNINLYVWFEDKIEKI